jgi:hypothetical protein
MPIDLENTKKLFLRANPYEGGRGLDWLNIIFILIHENYIEIKKKLKLKKIKKMQN